MPESINPEVTEPQESGTTNTPADGSEDLQSQLKTLLSENEKLKGINKEVIAQRDQLKQWKRANESQQPDGKSSQDILTLQAKLTELEQKAKLAEEKESKRIEKLESIYESKLKNIPDDKKELFSPILEQAQLMDIDDRLGWLDNTIHIFTGEKSKPTIPELNPSADEPSTVLTTEEKTIAQKYGWSLEKALEYKAEDPEFFKTAIENRKKK